MPNPIDYTMYISQNAEAGITRPRADSGAADIAAEDAVSGSEHFRGEVKTDNDEARGTVISQSPIPLDQAGGPTVTPPCIST